MSYTAKPPFNVPPGAQNQSQQSASGARDPAAQIHLGAQNPSAAVQNAPPIANNASVGNNLLANAGSLNVPAMTNRQIFQSHQRQQLLQQQLFLQQFQQQPASLQRMVTDYQKSLTSAVSPPNGNLSTSQQMLNLTQPAANLITLLQQAQAQCQQEQQQQQQRKPFQQPVPLPSNTTITPVSSRQQNFLPAGSAGTQQKSVANYSPAKPSQSKQSQAAQARRNMANLPKSTPILPPAMSSQANIKTSTASNYTAAKLAPNVSPSHYGGIANVKTANVPPLPNVSISKVQVATGDSVGASKAGSNVAVPINASVKPDVVPLLKPVVPAVPPVIGSPSKLSVPPKPEKLSTSPKVNAPVSPRTKQTPRKNSNPIKTTPPSKSTASAVVTAASTTAISAAPKVVTAVATSPSKPTVVAQSNNLVSKPDVAVTLSKPATTTTAAALSTVATPQMKQKQQQQQQPVEKSPKPASVTPAKATTVPKVSTVEKPAPAAPEAANKTPTKSNDAVDAGSVKKSPAPVAKSTPVTPKTAAATEVAATPKATAAPKSAPKTATPSSVDQKIKRNRLRTIPYQSPIPEIELISKLTANEANNSSKNSEDKLIIFYKSEFLAVRNDEGGFFLCQAIQNVYKSSPRIRIRWLSEEKPNQNIYSLDFYDHTDIDCVLTTVSLEKQSKGKFELTNGERERVQNILQKALDVEKGIAPRPDVTEENPDGLDLSLYKNESQIEKKTPTKRKASEPRSTKKTPSAAATAIAAVKQKKLQKADDSDDDDNYEPSKKRKKTPIKSSARKKAPPPKSTAKKAAPKATPLQKSAAKADVNATKDDKEVIATPKATKAPAKRKLIEKVDTPTVAKPNEADKDKPKSDKASVDEVSSPKATKVTKTSEKSATTTPQTSGGRTTRRSRV